jgi:hypothetical protein
MPPKVNTLSSIGPVSPPLNASSKPQAQLSPNSVADAGVKADSVMSTVNSPSVLAIKGDPSKPNGIQP